MLEFKTNNYLFFTRKEFWFYNGEELKEGSYNVFSCAKKTLDNKTTQFLEKYNTTVIDLTEPEEKLFNGIHATYRYDIRSAEKQEIEHKIFLKPSLSECKNLVHAYNIFAKTKKLPAMNLHRVIAIQRSGNICITKAFLKDAEVCTHVYIFDKNIVSLMSSFHNVSFENDKLRSEANKYLHWKDILFFKIENFKEYDFGGLNLQKLPGVSKFKMNFGGETVVNYRYIKTIPLFYYLVSLIKKMR